MESLDNITSVFDASNPNYLYQKKFQTRCLPVSDPIKEAEVLESIDAAYYIEDDFDPVEYELKKMAESNLLPEVLTAEVGKLKKQLQVVSKRISTKIMENSPSYSAELQNVNEIQADLGGIIAMVSLVRKGLRSAKNECRNGLEIIANYRNRNQLRRLKSSLEAVKTLYDIEFQLNDLIQEGNFPEAISLCKEAQIAAASCSQFICIRELAEKLKGTMEDFAAYLSTSLASMTVIFDPDRYTPVYRAYKMLGRLEEAAAEIVRCFHETLDTSSRRVIAGQLLSRLVHADIEALSYEQLCEAVEAEQMHNCVWELGFVLCKVLFTYHSILRYHIDEDERMSCAESESGWKHPHDVLFLEFVGVVRKKLVNSLYDVFKTASQKFNTLLCCHDLSVLKFDIFLDIVELSNRFQRFGRTYFGNACGEIAISLEKQTYLYFGRYHCERMEELRMFLENETFALCPVPVQFTLFDLQESAECFDDGARSADVEAGLGEQLDHQMIPHDLSNPFSPENKTAENNMVYVTPQRLLEYNDIAARNERKSVVTNSTDGADDVGTVNLSQVFCDGNGFLTDGSQQSSPILCNTALNLLRFFGRYIRMTYLLRSVAEQAVFALFQLFNYFLYSIHSFFSSDGEECDIEQLCSQNFLALLKCAAENVLREANTTEGNTSRVLPCSLSPVVQLSKPEQLYGLCERVVGVESVVFLAKQLNVLHPILESLLSCQSTPFQFTHFFIQVLPHILDIRKCIYGCVARRVLDYKQLTSLVCATKWDICELQSQHSSYVDFLLQGMKTFGASLSDICQLIPLPREIISLLWDCVICCAFHAVVQGYCEPSKKCSSEGRALMQLDLQQMSTKIEQLTGIKPVPHKAYVENYIKAYYLPERSLEQWILQHSEYSASQMVSLLNVASHVSKKARSRIISLLPE